MKNKIIKTYKDLIVWKKSMDLVAAVYELTSKFPKEELFGLSSQMKRSAVSIPSNIAEGRRSTRKDFRGFLVRAFGSGAELETQVEISKKLYFGKCPDYFNVVNLLEEVMKMLNKMISNLQATS